MLPPGSPVDGYARVSTDDQADTGSSMRAQAEAIRATCGRLGLTLAELIEDGGESSKTMDRPGLQRVLTRLESGASRGVVVAHIDRLTRNLRDACLLVDRHFTRPDGCELISAAEPVDTRSAVGRLQFFILITVSQFQRESGVERTRETLATKRTGSERLGRDKFGKRTNPDDPRRSKTDRPIGLEDDPADLAALEVMRARAAEGWGVTRIAAELDALGFRPKRGGARWGRSTVYQFLHPGKRKGHA